MAAVADASLRASSRLGAPAREAPELAGRALLVASTGGHLAELHELSSRLRLSEPAQWVTFDTEQSRSLLRGERVHHVAFTAPRDVVKVMGNTQEAVRLLRRERFDLVVSTGAAVALSFLPVACALGASCHYIESAARTTRPSLTGRLLAQVPGVNLYTQWPACAGPRWRFAGSVFDAFAGAERLGTRSLRRVVVTLGTMPFGFRRLVTRIAELLDGECEILWQTGATDVRDLGIAGVEVLPAHELGEAMRDADLVISHAGVGSALSALEAGHCPVLVPRARAHREHVDDHQELVGQELEQRGLAVCASPQTLTRTHLERAAARRARRVRFPSAFKLSA